MPLSDGSDSRVEPRTCIGYGDREGVCTNPAGTPWGPLWCMDCDQVRLATISQQMKAITDSFGGGS